MKTIFGVLIFSLTLNAHAQGVMPVPTGVFLLDRSCEQNQSFDILSDPLLRPFQINLSSLICNEESLYADAFSPGANYQHNRTRCDEISTCSLGVSPEDIKDADAIISQNIPTVAYLSALTKAVEADRVYNANLYQYEKKHKTKVCAEEAIDFDCDHQLRMALATVADSLVDYPEFDRAPLSKDDLTEFIPGKFFANQSTAEKTLDDLKKDCSKKFSVKNVCSQAKVRIEAMKKCDQDKTARNCFDEEQRAWASLTNDFKNSNKQLFLAIEKQLCLPQRTTKSATQSTLQTFSPLFLRTQRKRVLSDEGFARTQQLLTTAKLNTEKDISTRPDSSVPKNLDVKQQESFSLGDGLNRAARETESFGVDKRDPGISASDTFSENVKQVLDKNNNLLNTVNSHQNTGNWNTDVLNRAREIAEEQKIQEEERRRQLAEKEDEVVTDSEKKKKDEISTLTAQIDGLKSKLESMTEKMEELQSKKETAAASGDDESKQESLKREKEILELKKQIAQLEADKKKKEEDSRLAKLAEESRLERERTERNRSFANQTATFASQSRNSQGSVEHAADKAGIERDKASRAMAAAYDSAGGGRSPASLGSSSASVAVSNQLVLKSVGSQSSPESTIVYMTPNELQRYPYRLSGNATHGEIEKMLEGNQGSTIILGESEQVVPIMENGKILYDEQGKIKYKRIKISLVKNDKERKQQIAREISSLADLKKEEQKKRDLIRYQEMKKAIKVP